MQKKILIVDDQPINRAILNKLLCGQYEVLEAENGQSCPCRFTPAAQGCFCRHFRFGHASNGRLRRFGGYVAGCETVGYPRHRGVAGG
jgi:hypothetical protein